MIVITEKFWKWRTRGHLEPPLRKLCVSAAKAVLAENRTSLKSTVNHSGGHSSPHGLSLCAADHSMIVLSLHYDIVYLNIRAL